MRHCPSACALDHHYMDISAAIYVAVTGRECMQHPKTPLMDYLPEGFLIHCRASMRYIDGDRTVGNRAQGVSVLMPQLMSACDCGRFVFIGHHCRSRCWRSEVPQEMRSTREICQALRVLASYR
jgi:hypothetical protein